MPAYTLLILVWYAMNDRAAIFVPFENAAACREAAIDVNQAEELGIRIETLCIPERNIRNRLHGLLHQKEWTP